MRLRHDIFIDRPYCATTAFALVADLGRLPERFPELPPPRVREDRAGAAGHAVEIGPEGSAIRITVTRLGPGLAIALDYSNGIAQDWRVVDHGTAGCMLSVIVELARVTPGEEAEQYRAGLLADLETIRHLVLRCDDSGATQPHPG